MCAINPRHKKRILLDFYTSSPKMTKEQFEDIVRGLTCQMEILCNNIGIVRCHAKETEQEAE